jgi:hypothetical protein
MGSFAHLAPELFVLIFQTIDKRDAMSAAMVWRSCWHQAASVIWSQVCGFKIITALLIGAHREPNQAEINWHRDTLVSYYSVGVQAQRRFDNLTVDT